MADRPRVRLLAGESIIDAVDLGWVELQPFVGRPKAAADFASLGGAATVVFATEQDERLRALLEESGVRARLSEGDLDLDLELRPALERADIDISAGCVYLAEKISWRDILNPPA